MAKYENVIVGDFDRVVEIIEEDMINSGVSMRLVDESNYTLGGTPIAVRIYDKYYARNGNRASLSITMAGNDDTIYISEIGSGGGQGIFFYYSLGAENDMVAIVQESVEKIIF
ncbi:MAG: hypothetical protein GX829_04010 [Clostridium sp.]|nr:hypothetical protein [Clostridium sp.]